MTASSPYIISLQVGRPREFRVAGSADPMDRPLRTGIYKEEVQGEVWLGTTNLAGDGQGDLKHHGGPDKAVCVYPREHYPYWRDDLQRTDLLFGAFGENFTTEGQTEAESCIGDLYRVGDAIVQISQPRQPCWRLARRWRVHDLAARVQATGRTGWYLRVLQEGEVSAGLPLELLERPYPQWTIARANEVMHRSRHDRDAAAELAACPLLSSNWRSTLRLRAATGENPDPHRRIVGPNEN